MRSELRERLLEDFQNEEARYAYVEDFLNAQVAAQIKNTREARGMNQQDLADKIGTKQSGISRLENVNYDSWKVETLRKLARALRVRLRISFEEFGTLFPEIDSFGKRLAPLAFEDDPVFNPKEANLPSDDAVASALRELREKLVKVRISSSALEKVACSLAGTELAATSASSPNGVDVQRTTAPVPCQPSTANSPSQARVPEASLADQKLPRNPTPVLIGSCRKRKNTRRARSSRGSFELQPRSTQRKLNA
jgi:transcriptional regulator with XRE-family HTH domain